MAGRQSTVASFGWLRLAAAGCMVAMAGQRAAMTGYGYGSPARRLGRVAARLWPVVGYTLASMAGRLPKVASFGWLLVAAGRRGWPACGHDRLWLRFAGRMPGMTGCTL